MHQENNPESVKVTIEIEDSKFYCNRTKLSKNSDYFNVMFNGDFAEKDQNLITIQDVPANGFQNCLEIIDETLELLEYDQLLETLHCACVLQFENIKTECIKRLTDNLRIEYCLEIWNVTEFLDIHPLCEKAKCCAFLEFNTIINKHKASISQMTIKQLHSYLANHFICCDNELDIFQTGMNWWYDNSTKLQESENWKEEDTNKYLYTILSCINFKNLTTSDVNHMLTFPDIKDNKEISTILSQILLLLEDPTSKVTDFESKVINLFFNTKQRNKELLPCIITSEYPWDPHQSKRSKSIVRKVNISYYDRKRKTIEHLFTNETEFLSTKSQSLNGSKILSYKQNILLFGGEYSYGSANWNRNVYMYHTFTNEWTIIAKMPKERRHFNACIVDDKLVIMGGTGKYRIRAINDMVIYDIQKDTWTDQVFLPYSWNEVQICEFQKQLLVVPAVPDNKFVYIFDFKALAWRKLSIIFPPNFKFDFTKTFIVFSKADRIYIKGFHFLEMRIEGADVKVLNFLPQKELYGDKLNNTLIDDNLYIFSQHGAADSEYIYQLHCFNLGTKKTELLLQINDNIDQMWHIRRGCFSFFYFDITKEVKCISNFPL